MLQMIHKNLCQHCTGKAQTSKAPHSKTLGVCLTVSCPSITERPHGAPEGHPDHQARKCSQTALFCLDSKSQI